MEAVTTPAPLSALAISDRGRQILLRLERELPRLHPFASRALVAHIERLLDTYREGPPAA